LVARRLARCASARRPGFVTLGYPRGSSGGGALCPKKAAPSDGDSNASGSWY
jgi:hypothetical protein